MKTLYQVHIKFPWRQVYEAYGEPCSMAEARAKSVAIVAGVAGAEIQVHPVKVANGSGKGKSG